jgi:hypothetical protein
MAAVNTRPPSSSITPNPVALRSVPPPQPPAGNKGASDLRGAKGQAGLPENKPATFTPAGAAASSSTSSAAAGSGGDRKPAGQVRGGGDAAAAPEKRIESKTKFGAWSSNMAIACGYAMLPLGAISILWYFVDPDNHSFFTFLCGCYSIIVGIGIVWYETNFGTSRGSSRFPLRALVYLALSIFCFFTISTYLVGIFLLLVFVTNFVACVLLKEKYTAPDNKAHARAQDADLVKVDSFCEGMTAWFQMIKQQNKKGSMIFMLIYALSNMFLFAWTVNQWQEKNAGINPVDRLSDWGPWAKGFGSLLDLNCAIIVLPVSRTVLRMLYNRSTADQGTFARFLRAILEYIPIDSAITFHKIIAYGQPNYHIATKQRVAAQRSCDNDRQLQFVRCWSFLSVSSFVCPASRVCQ